jgi:hypothetical protein
MRLLKRLRLFFTYRAMLNGEFLRLLIALTDVLELIEHCSQGYVDPNYCRLIIKEFEQRWIKEQ